MARLYSINKFQKLPDFVAEHCHEVTPAQQEAACRIIAKYNRRHIRNPLLANQCITIPDDLAKQLNSRVPRAQGIAPWLSHDDGRALNALLQQHSDDEIWALERLVDSLPKNEDTLKAFAGGLLGASQIRGKAYLRDLQAYNDTLVQWKNTPKRQRNKVETEIVQPAHQKLDRGYKSESRSMARRSPALRSVKRGIRAQRRSRHSIDLTNTEDVLRLKRLLKIARVSALGAIIIDTGLVTQKVKHVHEAGENAEKVAYEEYAALIVGIAAASVTTVAAVYFFGPGLIILTVVGGIGALMGAEGGRELGRRLYEQISTYEATISDAAMSAL